MLSKGSVDQDMWMLFCGQDWDLICENEDEARVFSEDLFVFHCQRLGLNNGLLEAADRTDQNVVSQSKLEE
jgi:hypothetical protein